MRIILASGSPRRRQILEQAGIPCKVMLSDTDETIDGGTPAEIVQELALRKGEAVFAMLGEEANDTIIIAADTVVYIDEKIKGKPHNREEAFDMLSTLSGRKHYVYTGVALLSSQSQHIFADIAEVFFRDLSPQQIAAYIATGEPMDKAGAYGIQERGALLVDRINGDFYTVMGLPIAKTAAALTEMGYDIWV